MRALFAIVASGGAFLAVASCADNETSAAMSDQDGSTSLPPGPDAGPPPVPDASIDVRPDVVPRTCSDEKFCHTVLPDNQTLQAVWSDAAGVAWAGTKYGVILRWDGEWKVHASSLGELNAVTGVGPTDVWAAGEKGIYHGTGATSATLSFVRTPLPDKGRVHIKGLWARAANDVWAVGAHADTEMPARGRVYHFKGDMSGGAPVWEVDPASAIEGATYERVLGSTGSGLWVVQTVPYEWGTREVLLRRAPSATELTEVVLPPIPESPDAPIGHVYGASVESDTSIWLVARSYYSGYGVFHGVSADGGATFDFKITSTWIENELEYNVVSATSSGVWFAGNFGRLGTWDGKKFHQAVIEVKRVPVVDPFFDVWTSATGEIWAVGKGIALHRAKQ